MSSRKMPTAPELEEPLLPNSHSQGLLVGEVAETVTPPVAQQVIRVRVQEAEILVEQEPLVVNAVTVDSDTAAADDENNIISNPQARGHWKDSICNCCAHGCCHPSFVCSCFCPLIAVAQVMRRLNLLITGKRGSNCQSKVTFFMIMALSLTIHYLTRYVLDDLPDGGGSHQNRDSDSNSILVQYPWIVSAISFSFYFLLFYLIVTTRSYIRRKYSIPERNCVGCEDCCVALCFPWCSISQMMRHTTDYHLYRAAWCSDTGLPGGVPSIV